MKRLWEVDFFRGIAIVLMIIFNWSFTLKYFNIFSFESWFYWHIFPRIIASMFIFIAGISLVLSHGGTKSAPSRHILRGLKIFCFGIMITLSTWLLFPQEFIIFGILHLIGISIILAAALLKYKRLSLMLGIAFIAVGFILQNFRFDFSWLVWLGLIPINFQSLDYFPIFPWFGIFLLGMFFGNSAYPKGKRNFRIKDSSELWLVENTAFLGRHSLFIYMIHQPVLILLLLLLGFRIF